MTVPVYPLDKCPYPVRDNFSSQYAGTFPSIKMDRGGSRNRRAWASQAVNFTVVWNMNFKQYEQFEGFLRWDCDSGNRSFMLKLSPEAPAMEVEFKSYPQAEFDESRMWIVRGDLVFIRPGPVSLPAPDSIASYPAGLPLPEKDGYTIARPDAVTRTQGDDAGGLSVNRMRSSNDTASVNMTFKFTAEEYAIFDNWGHETLLSYVLPFKGYFINGYTALTDKRMQFISYPKVTSISSGYSVSVQVQVTDIPGLTELEYRGIPELTFDDTITLADSLTAYTNGYFEDGYVAPAYAAQQKELT